jgi:DNA repair protein RecO (recombination protein O)
MNWEDEGFLLSKTKFRENANIINVFSKLYGRVNGIVYGGNSRKIKNYLQVSNKIFVFYTSKNENRIGYFKTELIEPIAPRYFNDKKRTSALLSISSILNALLPERQPNKTIYKSLIELIKNLNNKNWLILYIYWELKLIKELGFDPNLSIFNNVDPQNNEISEVNVDGIKYLIPSFLVTNNIPQEISSLMIQRSLTFTRSILINKFFIPNNLMFPKSRIILENYYN